MVMRIRRERKKGVFLNAVANAVLLSDKYVD